MGSCLLKKLIPVESIVNDSIPEGVFHGPIGFEWGKYKFFAYPGSGVVGEYRAEHKPYHFHIELKGKTHYRVCVDNDKLKELDQKKLPKKLRKYIMENAVEIHKRVISVYYTGNI